MNARERLVHPMDSPVASPSEPKPPYPERKPDESKQQLAARRLAWKCATDPHFRTRHKRALSQGQLKRVRGVKAATAATAAANAAAQNVPPLEPKSIEYMPPRLSIWRQLFGWLVS